MVGGDQGSCFIQVEILGKGQAGFLVQISTVELPSYELWRKTRVLSIT